jgi:hypothetical protein
MSEINETSSLADSILMNSRPAAPFELSRRLGLDKTITVTNSSGKYAWILFTPSPITYVKSAGIDKIGHVSRDLLGGEIKCQQFGMKHGDHKEVDLDNSHIHYTVFFECDGKWKCPYKDRKINAKIYDINLTPKNVEDALDTDFIPR